MSYVEPLREARTPLADFFSTLLGDLQAVEPVVLVAFGVGDCEYSDFCLKLKEHECVGESGEQGTPDIEIDGCICKSGDCEGPGLYGVLCLVDFLKESGGEPWLAGFVPGGGFGQLLNGLR